MKFFALVLLVQYLMIEQSLGEFTAQKYLEMHDKCVAQTGVSEDAIERGRKGDFDGDPTFKYYLKCCLEEENAIHPDGTIDVERLIDSFHDVNVAKYEKPLRECIVAIKHDGDTLNYIHDVCYCVYEKTLDKFDIP